MVRFDTHDCLPRNPRSLGKLHLREGLTPSSLQNSFANYHISLTTLTPFYCKGAS